MLPGQKFVDAGVALAERAATQGALLIPERHAELTPFLAWGRVDVVPFLPTKTADVDVYPRCEQGRWLVDCPFCSGAQFASKTDPRFFCIGCLCEQVGAKWLRVVWPDGLGEIEEALRVRETKDVYYLPGETAADIHEQNREQGWAD